MILLNCQKNRHWYEPGHAVAKQVHDRIAAARWEQERLGVKPRQAWEEAVLRWLLETKHKATHDDDKAKLRWLDPYLGGKTFNEIDRTLIDRIKFDREKIASAGTTNRYLALIRAILKRACDEWEWIDRVPKFNLFREAEGRVRSLTPEEFERLRQELPEHLADMAVFSVFTGLRSANVKGLEWTYVDLERKHAWIPGSKHKNGKPHSVPLNERAHSVLRKQLGKHPTRVFTSAFMRFRVPLALRPEAISLDSVVTESLFAEPFALLRQAQGEHPDENINVLRRFNLLPPRGRS